MDGEGQRVAGAFERASELAHAELQRAIAELEALSEPPFDLAKATGLVEDLLRTFYGAVEGRGDALAAVVESRALAEGALAELSACRGGQGPLEGVARHLEAALDGLEAMAQNAPPAPPEPPAPPAPPEPLRASVELPSLQRLDRPLLTPRLRAPRVDVPPPVAPFAPLPPPKTHAELEGHAERARGHIQRHLAEVFAARARPQPSTSPEIGLEEEPSREDAFIARWARECFDEVAMIGSQRRPLLGDDWRTSEELEQRLLTALDAFAALAPTSLACLERLVLDAPAPDPERLFAAGMLAGAVAGRDTLGLGERLARAGARDPAALDRFAAALALVPHPHVEAMLRSWLDDGDPRYREIGARLLIARGGLDPEELVTLAGDRPEIAAHALVPLALARHPSLELRLERAFEASPLRLRRAGWLALALTSRPRAAERLRAELDGRHADEAAWLLGAIGSRADAERLLERALRQPTPSSLGAVAIAGHLGAIEGLLHLLAWPPPPPSIASPAPVCARRSPSAPSAATRPTFPIPTWAASPARLPSSASSAIGAIALPRARPIA
jgi:hypothetical protein